jgi:hypothetical protein
MTDRCYCRSDLATLARAANSSSAARPEDHLARFVLTLVRDDLDLIEISGHLLQ